MAYQGINHRATAGYVTDGAGETYSLGEAYPTTRGGQTFGYSANVTGDSRDRGSSVDRRLAGFVGPVSGVTFRIDLPSLGVGTIRLAIGDLSFPGPHYVELLDGGVVFATITGTTTNTLQFIDASGAILAGDSIGGAAWNPSNISISRTFTSTNFTIKLGDGASQTARLAHVSVDLAAVVTPEATIAWTEGADVIAAAVNVTISGTAIAAAWTEGADVIAMTGTAAGAAIGTITTEPMTNNAVEVLANETGVIANVYNVSTGQLVVQKTGLTSNALGVVTISDGLIVAGTSYSYEIVLTANGRRLPVAVAA